MGEWYHSVDTLHRTPQGWCHTRRSMPDRKPEPEQLLTRQVLVEGRLLTFRLDTVTDPDGEERRREVVVHPGGVAIVALGSDRRILLVRQYRHAVERLCLEIPAGTLDREANGQREAPLAAAQRELAEETGHRARDWRLLARFFTAPGFATEEMHLYLATGLEPADNGAGPDPDERLTLEVMPLDEAVAMVDAGSIEDAKTIVGLLLAARHVAATETES
jgi:ADP-ribose pyrophosphatase